MMKRIDDIESLSHKCTGCLACVDSCPTSCISAVEREDGFKYTVICEEKCVHCGKCYSVCPIETQNKHTEEQHLYAAYSKEQSGVCRASSGGIFELLACYFLENGYLVCGAAFDKTQLYHRIISSKEDLNPLLKSKYIQSNTEGIYSKIISLLKSGERMFFCGTPCQVSALVNLTPRGLRDRLFTADIICHGVPSQKMFDDYIKSLEVKHRGKLSEFSFRVKDNKYKHSHGYSYIVDTKNGFIKFNGIYTNSSYYNAFKNYLILRDSCYDCRYATLNRTSDITLADFWGIEKYEFEGNTEAGVSMVITNTKNGHDAFSDISNNMVCKELSVQCGIESNYCLTNSTKKPKMRDEIMKSYIDHGYIETAKKYFTSSALHRLYWLIPPKLRNFIRRMRGKR